MPADLVSVTSLAMAWLDDNPPKRRQFTFPRRADPSGVVAVHTAENTPDYVAFDGGAEAVARFIQTRTTAGSYHDLADSDSAIQLVRYDAEAYHDGTGTNPHSYGVSVATRADVWPLAPAEWRAGAVRQAAAAAARYARWLHKRRGIVIPARRITAAQARAGVPGFVTHAELDPGRRSDPGAGFPWTAFLAEFGRLTADLSGAPTEDDDMKESPLLVTAKPGQDPTGAWWTLEAGGRVWCREAEDAGFLVFTGLARWDDTRAAPLELDVSVIARRPILAGDDPWTTHKDESVGVDIDEVRRYGDAILEWIAAEQAAAAPAA